MGNYTGKSLKMVLHLWDDSPKLQRFELPACMFGDVKSWVHEFTELTIWFTVRSFGFSKELLNKGGFKIKLPDKINDDDGEIQIHKPAHVLTVLHTFGLFQHSDYEYGIICSSDEYFERLL